MIRILLIGRTGCGKSSTANTLAGKTVFETGTSGLSITTTCQRAEFERCGKNIIVCDTPGFFGTGLTEDAIKQELIKCFSIIHPGPHVILYVLKIGRLTKEEIMAVKRFLKLFGGNPLRYTVIVLTGKDDLDCERTSTEKYIQDIPSYFRKFLSKCSNRVVFFNNRETEAYRSQAQLTELFKTIELLLDTNEAIAPYFSRKIMTNSVWNKYKKGSVIALAGGILCFLVGVKPVLIGVVALVSYVAYIKMISKSSKECAMSHVIKGISEDRSSICRIS